MDYILPVKNELKKMSNDELLLNFQSDTPIYGKVNYYGEFASRLPKFKELLFEEAIKPKNINQKFFNFVKIAWLPVISLFEHSTDKNLHQEIANVISSNWPLNELDNFKAYFTRYKPEWLEHFPE